MKEEDYKEKLSTKEILTKEDLHRFEEKFEKTIQSIMGPNAGSAMSHDDEIAIMDYGEQVTMVFQQWELTYQLCEALLYKSQKENKKTIDFDMSFAGDCESYEFSCEVDTLIKFLLPLTILKRKELAVQMQEMAKIHD